MTIYDKSGNTILDIVVDDNSYRYRAIMGENSLTLYFALAEHTELPLGAYCDFQGERYALMRPEALKMRHSRYFEYTVTLESAQAKAKIWKFRNPVDGRLKFSLTAKPHEHLQMFVDNMNRRDAGWSVGSCIDAAEKCISYDHDYCWDALCRMASEFNTEFEINGKEVSLRKVEYNKSNPLALSYGRGNGFKPNVGRSNYGDTPPIEILYTQGGDRNIDPSRYGSSELHLPINATIGYDGEKFDDESGYNPDAARRYATDDLGMSVRRTDKLLQSLAEDSLDCSEIYPKRVGRVTGVAEQVGGNENFYDFIDSTIPETLNFEDYLIEGETMTVVFQTGMLAGKEFDVKYHHEATATKLGRRFEIVPQEIDGQMMPNDTFKPSAVNGGDEYVVFKCSLPQEYIESAERDMMRQAVKYLYDHEEQDFSFSGTLDGIWAKKDWVNIGGRLVLGGFILFTDERFQQEGVRVRITGIKEYVNNPHSPELELSNSTVTGSVAGSIKTIESQEVIYEDNHRAAIEFTKRRFRDAKETINLLGNALLDNFTNSINPITIETMSVLVGDESLQFRFVDDRATPTSVAHQVTYDQAQKQLNAEAGLLQHMTIGITSMSNQHSASEYSFWNVSRFTSARLDDPNQAYYLYAKCSKSSQSGEFVLSPTAIKMEAVEGYYHFLMGVLNSEYDGERSYASLYGFTEILPSRVTTDRVVSGDGQSYFDMVANAMKLGEALDFNSQGDGTLRLRGTLVQSQSGDESYLGCYRGVYNDAVTYYNGDEVSYESNGCWSTYRQIYPYGNSCVGIPPTNTLYWQVIAQGSVGAQGVSPNTAFKSFVFKRATTKPSKPSGGSYENPVPSGWSDGVPTGEAILWMSTRIFSSDSKAPQQAQWTEPRQLTDTADFDVEFSSVENPNPPSGHPNTNQQWSNESNDTTIWMATSTMNNGVWSAWQVSRIKGERGENGDSIHIRGTLANVNQLPTPPADPSDCYIIDNDLWVWDGDSWVNAGQFKGEDGKNAYLHIKFAISLSPFQWSANNGETPSNYIGIYCDNSPTDLLDRSKYQWTKWVGDDGFGYEYIYKLTQAATAPSTPSATSQADDFVPTESPVPTGQTAWTDDPQDVSEAYPYCWVCYRKKTDGVWGAFVGSAADNSHAALWAKFGADGADGDYTEYRFKANGSPTTAPTLSFSTTNPDFPTGWTLTLPTLTSTAKYIWMTFAIRDGATGAIKQGWSSPVRISAADGVDGTSPALVYRGTYSATATYYGNEHRVDCVKYGSQWYVARVDAPNGTSGFSAKFPTNTSYWNSFGASFDSVATSLLLADNGNLAGFIFKNNTLVSQKGTINGVASEDFGNASFVPNISIDAVNGIIRQGNNITIDSSGITLYNGSGAITGKITNSSVGDVSGLENMNKTFSTTISYSASGFNSYSTTASNVPLFTHETHIGHCCKGSQIRFTSMAVGFVMPYAFSTSNLTGSQIGIIMRDYVVAVNLYCDNRLVQELGSYMDSRLQSGENFSNNFNASRTMTVDGGTYPEGVYVLRVECVADALQFGVSSGSSAYYNTTVNLLPRFNYSKAGFTKTLIGNDGMYSCWGDNKFILATAQGIVLRHGSYALRLTDSGIQKTTNSGSSWGNI